MAGWGMWGLGTLVFLAVAWVNELLRRAGRPDLAELTARLERSRAALATGARRALDRERRRLDLSRDHLRRAPLLLVERRRAAVEHSAGRLRALSPRATLDRGYAIVRTAGSIVRSSSEVATGAQVDVELGSGGFGATVEDTR